MESYLNQEMELSDVVLACKPIHYQWKIFGTIVGIPYSELEGIRYSTYTVMSQFTEVIAMWQRQKPKKFNWSYLLKTIRCNAIGNNLLADTIEQKLIKAHEQHTPFCDFI